MVKIEKNVATNSYFLNKTKKLLKSWFFTNKMIIFAR